MKTQFILFVLFYCLGIWSLSAQGTPAQGEEDTTTQRKLPSLAELEKERKARFLVLEKPGKVKRLRFFVGDKLIFHLKNDHTRYNATIEAIQDSSITVRGIQIPLSEFRSITVFPHRPWSSLLSSAALIGGTGYFLIDLVNHSFTPLRSSWYILGGGLLVGLGLKTTLKRTYRLNNRRYLRTILVY